MTTTQNQYVNVLKGIACIIVVFLHCPFPGILGDAIIYSLRFSVPVFFMISGYYSFAKKEDWISNKALYILKLLIFSEIFYTAWGLIRYCIIENYNLNSAIAVATEGKNILQIIFCGTLYNPTLWYLYAMFWTWLLILFIRKKNFQKWHYVLIPILLIFLIFGRIWIQNVADINKYVFLFRNALSFGLPFTLLGMWIRKHEKKLLERCSLLLNIVILLIGGILLVIEFLTYGQYMDAHTSTVFIAIGLFLLAIRQTGPIPVIFKPFAWVGGELYTWIYLFHMFFGDIANYLFKLCHIPDDSVFRYLYPIVVCIFAIVCSKIIIIFTQRKKHAS